ncbi:S-methyl-5-thioribose-1-phosphate isomerase [Chrysiogenes arsenatis]|uniref:S-methyl-5-thioribose-1-phosphate isomerase n=1 Tax=Chrysiogenes arsenatis TaxID=309797 RepID=UPI0004051053|nr:S-methyl-5-thioribose-1-phosphate isomerase [Chrysiogenes arsenatis]
MADAIVTTAPFVLQLLDQRILPLKVEYIACRTHNDVADAIRTMVVRGAPAIGVSAAYGYALGAHEVTSHPLETLANHMQSVRTTLAATRPTAVNLFWALEAMEKACNALIPTATNTATVANALWQHACQLHQEDIAINRRIGAHGAALLPDHGGVLTHCNAGALATAGYGTALGVIRAAVEQGKRIHVFTDETRPFLQGARLSAFELMEDNIPVTLICDNMAGVVMRQRKVQAIVVGADRIAMNGDTANKIGTYTVAVLARENNIPFYVAAPVSTIDPQAADESDIVIEERDPREVTHCGGVQIAPHNVAVFNPSFDVTPARYISGIITQHGIAKAPFDESLREHLNQSL